MYIVDDPTLALIARFVGEGSDNEVSDAAFFAQQIAAIQEYLAGFAAEEREQRAMEWITANARKYRQQWQKQAALGALPATRCRDCPLAGGERKQNCAIHTHWLALLRHYAAARISSHEYVERSLALLSAHKDQLKVQSLAIAAAAPPNAAAGAH